MSLTGDAIVQLAGKQKHKLRDPTPSDGKVGFQKRFSPQHMCGLNDQCNEGDPSEACMLGYQGPRKGGSLFEFSTPPPLPSRPPKVFEPVFLQFQILGESVGAKGTEIFFWPC